MTHVPSSLGWQDGWAHNSRTIAPNGCMYCCIDDNNNDAGNNVAALHCSSAIGWYVADLAWSSPHGHLLLPLIVSSTWREMMWFVAEATAFTNENKHSPWHAECNGWINTPSSHGVKLIPRFCHWTCLKLTSTWDKTKYEKNIWLVSKISSQE